MRPTVTELDLKLMQERIAGNRKPAPFVSLIPPKQNKMRNSIVRIGDEKFDSKKEYKRYLQLRQLKEDGVVKDFSRQVKYSIVVNGDHICKYIADFVITYPDGKVVVEDVKGMRFGAAYQMFRLKKKLLKATLGIEVIEV